MLGSTPSAKDWAFYPTSCWHTLQGWSSSVFVTAIADYLCQVARFREDGFDDGKIARVKRETKDTSILADMLRYPEPRADNDAGHRRAVQNVADTDIGDAHAMFVGGLFQDREQFLEQGPSAPCIDHVLVLL